MLLVSSFLSTAYAQTQCLSFSSALGYGMSDASANGPIALLQQYLNKAGYLTVPSTGYFGPATLSAVEEFQSAHNISATGYVGALTGAALNQITCGNNTVNTSSAHVVTTSPAQSSTAPTITAPLGGQTLSTGQTFAITWTNQPYARYDIVLMSPNGAGAGFIAQGLVGVNQYLWTVGNVFSSQSQSNQVVQSGQYQIRIQNSAVGAEPTDPITNPFTIGQANLSVSSVFPAAVPANGNTAVVLYGSGFNTATTVNFGTNTTTKGQVLYASPDGTVLVFTVPTTGTVPGTQSISVTNQSGQSSNQLSFTIIAP